MCLRVGTIHRDQGHGGLHKEYICYDCSIGFVQLIHCVDICRILEKVLFSLIIVLIPCDSSGSTLCLGVLTLYLDPTTWVPLLGVDMV